MPAMGAIPSGDSSRTAPIDVSASFGINGVWHQYGLASIGFYIRGIDFHGDGLADEIDRQNEPRFQRIFPHQAPDDPAQRTMDHADHHALLDQRAGIVLQLAADEHADALDLVLGNR